MNDRKTIHFSIDGASGMAATVTPSAQKSPIGSVTLRP
jgi:hypothetical protein